MGNIQIIDIFFAIVAAFLIIKAVFNGFIEEFMGTLAFIGALVAGLIFSPRLSGHLSVISKNSQLTIILAFFIIFIAVYILVKILEMLFHKGIDSVKLNGLDRSLGFFYGIFESVVVILAILIILDNQHIIDCSNILKKSYVSQVGHNLLEYIGYKGIENIPFLRNF